MEKKNELAKEERTIFIVLAIIVLIAIGVLVTWYFTKDNKEESDTKTEVVDKQKKKKTTKDETETESAIIKKLDDEIIKEEVEETSTTVTIVYTNVKPVQEPVKVTDYKNDSLYYYIVDERIGFDKEDYGTIKEVYDYNDTNAGRGDEATGKYTVVSDTEIEFNTAGKYVVVFTDSNNNEIEVVLEVLPEDDFDSLINYYQNEFDPSSLITDTYYNHSLYNELVAAINDIDKTDKFTKRDSVYKVASLEKEFKEDLTIRNSAINEIATFKEYVANIDQTKLNAEEIEKVNGIINNHTNIIANANDVTLEELQQALIDQQQLAQDIDAIEQRVASYDNLQALITQIDDKISDNTYKQSNYTTNSWNDLQDALTDAKAITEENPKEEVDTANDNLEDAEDGLTTKSDAQAILGEKISTASTVYSNIVDSSTVGNTQIRNKIQNANNALNTARNNANVASWMANAPWVTPDTVDNANTTLETAINTYYATMSEALDDILANIETNATVLTEEDQAIYDSAKAGNLTNEQIISYAATLATYTV